MTYKLTATITHKSFGEPVIKEIFFQGDSFDDILAQIETLPAHLHNLKHYRRAAFKDARGVEHSWVLTHMAEMN